MIARTHPKDPAMNGQDADPAPPAADLTPAGSGDGVVAAALLGAVLLNRPIVDIFDRGGSIAGVPDAIAYVFGAWALLIAGLGWVVRASFRGAPPPPGGKR